MAGDFELRDDFTQKRLLQGEGNIELHSEGHFRLTYKYTKARFTGIFKQGQKHFSVRTAFWTLFPIATWLRKYSWKHDLFGDILAGLTLSVMHISHGLAFAPLAGQPAVTGLYMSVFPVLMYVIFSTSKHLSVGMFAVSIMMVGDIVNTHATPFDSENINGTDCYTPLEVGLTVTFVVGCWQLIFGLFHLGSLCVLLSNCVVSSFTCGAAVHIALIQAKNLFRIPIHMKPGPLKLVYFIYDLFKSITEVHIPTLVLSVTVIVILALFNTFLKPMIARRSKVPFPMEFLLIVLCIIVSYLINLEESLGLAVVGPVPSGLPVPAKPILALVPAIAWECLIIAIVSITVSISLATLYAKKDGYTLNGDQELRAYGISNIFGSFFLSPPVCGSLSRTAIQHSTGGKTQLASFFSGAAVLLVLLFAGFILEQVPLSVLSAMVMVTLPHLLMKIKELPKFWRNSKKEGIIWLITFSSVVLTDVEYGIAAGIILSVINLILIGVETDVVIIGNVAQKNDLLLRRKFSESTESQLCILQTVGALNFANSSRIIKKIRRIVTEQSTVNVIIDFSVVPYVDPTFLLNFAAFYEECISKNINVYLTSCCTLYDTFERCNFFQKYPKEHVIVSISEALKYLSSSL